MQCVAEERNDEAGGSAGLLYGPAVARLDTLGVPVSGAVDLRSAIVIESPGVRKWQLPIVKG